ncbi:hypothetical protein FJZ31_07565 [Candidatus Poribacteria bacterium]|nr:hypothetical protein [Candidatus Poribacteria bacterium]
MNIRRVSRPSIQQGSIAMTDIVINLFLFFVITFTLLYTFSEKLTKVDLPVASPQKEKVTGILLSITKERKTFVNENPVAIIDEKDENISGDIGELTAELQRILGKKVSENEKEYLVIVRADKSLPYRVVQKALNSVLASGISMVHFAILEEGRLNNSVLN